MSERVAIYTRISSDREGEQQGVGRQEDAARKLAERRGFEVAATFSDNDISASTRSNKVRPEYKAMLKRAWDGEFAAILAYSYSRLTRRPQEFNELIELAEKRGVKIITIASGEFDLNLAAGRAIARTIAAWDTAEAEQTGERIKAAQAQRTAQGEWHGGTVPYGYMRLRGSLVPNPHEVAMIEEAAKAILAGDTTYSLVQKWNRLIPDPMCPVSKDGSRGVRIAQPTRSGVHWRQANLRHILTNPTLLGLNKAGVKAKWPAIIDETRFELLGRIFSDPTRKTTDSPGVRGGKYSMGGGLTVCGICGCKLITQIRRGRPGLRCTKVVNGPKACGGVFIDHEHLEEYVFESVLNSFELPENSERMKSARAERSPEDQADVARLDAERDKVELRREKVADMWENDEIDKQSRIRRMAAIQVELERIGREKNAILNRTRAAEALAHGVDWKNWSPMRRRNFLSIWVGQVRVSKWPEDLPKNTWKKSDESPEDYSKRRGALIREAVDGRVDIDIFEG